MSTEQAYSAQIVTRSSFHMIYKRPWDQNMAEAMNNLPPQKFTKKCVFVKMIFLNGPTMRVPLT